MLCPIPYPIGFHLRRSKAAGRAGCHQRKETERELKTRYGLGETRLLILCQTWQEFLAQVFSSAFSLADEHR